MSPSRNDLAYIAGFIDGEGCFTIGFYNASKGRGRYHKAVLLIAQKSKDILVWIQATLGIGNSSIYLRKTTGVYYLRYQGKHVETIAKLLYPYFRVKKLQAETVIKFSKLKKKLNGCYYEKITPKDIVKRDALMFEMRNLNARYRTVKPKLISN